MLGYVINIKSYRDSLINNLEVFLLVNFIFLYFISYNNFLPLCYCEKAVRVRPLFHRQAYPSLFPVSFEVVMKSGHCFWIVDRFTVMSTNMQRQIFTLSFNMALCSSTRIDIDCLRTFASCCCGRTRVLFRAKVA